MLCSRFVIASSIPQVSYITAIEWYMLVSFAFMWANLLESAVWPAFAYALGEDGEPQERFSEQLWVAAYVLSFVGYNVHFYRRVQGILANRKFGKAWEGIPGRARSLRNLNSNTDNSSPPGLQSHSPEPQRTDAALL